MEAKTGFLFLFLTTLLFYCCKQKQKEEKSIVQEVQQTGVLVTAEYTLQKMVKASDNRTWYKLGDRKILLSAEAVVKAGVDLQQLKPQNVSVHDSTIQLQLPAPKIFSLSLPPEKIKVQYEAVDFFRTRFSAAEREALLRQAESQIRELADSLGILETAKTNAAAFLQRLLTGKGFRTVKVEFEK